MKYTVYDFDDNDRENGLAVEADGALNAAQQWAEREHGAGDPSDCYELVVVGEDGQEFDVSVDVEIDVTFYAHGMKRNVRSKESSNG